MSTIAKIFNSLEGNWVFQRTISDCGVVLGKASFERAESEKNLINYREEGQFFTQEGTHLVSQRYLYRYEEDKISAYFAEKKDNLFHTLDFQNATQATAKHFCARDVYDVTYEFHNPDEFELTYQVRGPQKNTTMTTLFQRLQNSENRS